MSEPVKYGGFLLPQWVTEQMYRDALGLPPDERTPEQKATDLAAYQQVTREKQAAQRAEHDALLASTDGFLRAVLVLHGPHYDDDMTPHPTCEGCDFGGYEAEEPDFPCRTYELARDWAGQS